MKKGFVQVGTVYRFAFGVRRLAFRSRSRRRPRFGAPLFIAVWTITTHSGATVGLKGPMGLMRLEHARQTDEPTCEPQPPESTTRTKRDSRPRIAQTC